MGNAPIVFSQADLDRLTPGQWYKCKVNGKLGYMRLLCVARRNGNVLAPDKDYPRINGVMAAYDD